MSYRSALTFRRVSRFLWYSSWLSGATRSFASTFPPRISARVKPVSAENAVFASMKACDSRSRMYEASFAFSKSSL